jgi:hypothetical protein
MDCRIPDSLQEEHDELRARIAQAVSAGGRTGEAAKEVAALVEPHMRKEEEFALPPLSMLLSLSRGEILPEMASALAQTVRLKEAFADLCEEHLAIAAALVDLADAARRENRPAVVDLAEALLAHARTEDEFLYPAAMLVGDVLSERLRLARAG